MKMRQLIATLLTAGLLASVAALADDAAVTQPAQVTAVKQELQQDKATVKADRQKLRADRQKLKADRKAAHELRKGRKHGKKKQAKPVVTEQPKS